MKDDPKPAEQGSEGDGTQEAPPQEPAERPIDLSALLTKWKQGAKGKKPGEKADLSAFLTASKPQDESDVRLEE